MPKFRKSKRVPKGTRYAPRSARQEMLDRDFFVLSLLGEGLPRVAILKAIMRKYNIGFEAARYSYRRAVRKTAAELAMNKNKSALVEHYQKLKVLAMKAAKDGNYNATASFMEQIAKLGAFYEPESKQPTNITVNTLALPGGGNGSPAMTAGNESLARLLAGMTNESLRKHARGVGLLPGGGSHSEDDNGESDSGSASVASPERPSDGEGDASEPKRLRVSAKVVR